MTERGWNPNDFFSSTPLYVEDSYIKEFDAEVIKAGPKFVILDQTAFYPDSGGQPSDKGTLTVDGANVAVVKVMKRGKDIYHYLGDDVPVGASVHGVIDWGSRFWNMRRHSGEHLLTGLFEGRGSGPKVYSDFSRLEFKPSGITEETVSQVWGEFDAIVEEDIPLRIYHTSRGELEGEEDERKRSFLDKIPRAIETLRMVEIPGHALTFCFGTHVKSTGEIGKLGELSLKVGKKGRRTVYFSLV
ncbi:MAG TPA: alanyl-tRNA editing protein [Patescibacteria group bacterium]|nr:alanyl-tRNA editing protein [Patescibacteria group bacterium]